MKELTLFLCFSFVMLLTLLHCVTSRCNTAQDCHPDIVGFTETVSENAIACTVGECVCNTCFVLGSDGNCTLSEGCWELVFSGGSFECRMKENTALFGTPAAVLFGVSAVLFVVPIIVVAVWGLAVVVCYRRCEKLEIPYHICNRLVIVVCVCFWTVSAVFILAGIILATTSESRGTPTCLQVV